LDLFFKTSGSSSIGAWTTTTTITNSYPINAVVELKAGKTYYAGEISIDVAENSNQRWNIFKNSATNDSIMPDFKKKYPNTFSTYKNDFAPVVFSDPTPQQAEKVIFTSHFAKSEGLWKESSDSLHTASFEDGHYCIESKSAYNMGTEIVELPEKLGKTVDIELRCKWISGTNKSGFGLILPGRYSGPLSAKCPPGEIEPRGYVFGISTNGYAGIWYECLLRLYEGNKNVKKMTTLADWKIIPTIKTSGSDQNVIHIQIIGQVIAYYVNDKFVSRAPFNSLAKLNAGDYMNYQNILEFTEFLNEDFKLLGIYSYKKQKIEFDELKVSRFK
jgi:hypothetical protein